MRNVLLLLALIAMTGCITKKKCQNRFPPTTSIEIKDSIVYKEKIVYRDTTVFVKLPPDTIVDSTVVYIHENKAFSADTLRKENSYSRALSWVYNSKLGLILMQKDTTIEFRFDSALQKAQYWEHRWQTEKIVEVNTVKYIPGFYKFTLWWFIGTAALIIGVVIGKIFLRKFV